MYDFEALTKTSKLAVAPQKLTDQELDDLEQECERGAFHYQTWVKGCIMQERERRKTAERHGKIE